MPANISKWVVLRDSSSYCSAPPLTTSSHILRPPRLACADEARRPRAPLRAVKAKVWESEVESVEFVVDEEEDVKPEVAVKIEPDPRQITMGWPPLTSDSPIRPPPRHPKRPIGQISECSRCAGSRLDSWVQRANPGGEVDQRGLSQGPKSRPSTTCRFRRSAPPRPRPEQG